MISGIGTVLGSYIWQTLIIPLEVGEPLEILYYPSELSLYPGETEEFNVTVHNSASVNYSIVLSFSLSNRTYQNNYVVFSHRVYTVIAGEQDLTAWLMVKSQAPSISASLTIDFSREPYPSGLVGYWKFDEGRGTIAFDSSGNDNHGLLVDVSWVEGKYGKALNFDGSSYLNCGTLGSFGSTDLGNATTYAFWLKTSQTSSSFILGTENEPYPSTVLVMHLNTPETDKIRFYMRDDNFKRLSGDLAERFDFTETGWHHFVLIADVKSNTLTFYIDGVPRSVTYRYRESPTAFSDFQYLLYIGAFNWMGSTKYESPIQPPDMVLFEGIIDEVRIYSRALNLEEVQTLSHQKED